ncbi:family 1 glycosylhydrolase, partial [Mesorhizobium japonicum]|uniref:family 1 glycosylhydrolase n=1 Tax=Mesorhizobium japonicum TaxID=2066070 RepID=UPI003B5A9B18
NYYTPTLVRLREGADPLRSAGPSPWPSCGDVEFVDQAGPRTDMSWTIDASGLEELLVRSAEEFGLPLAVTENGAAFADRVEDGRVR